MTSDVERIRLPGATRRRLAPVAAALLLVVTACGGGGDTAEAPDTTTSGATPDESATDGATPVVTPEDPASDGGPGGADPGNGDAVPGGGSTEDEGTDATLELTPATTTTTTPEDRAVFELLLDVPPLDGFTRADEVLGAGPLDLDAAARAEADVAAERALLETRGFERGASRAWLDPAQDVVYLAIYDFTDGDGAAAYLRDGIETLRARGATPFDVPEIEGAAGFTTVEESAEGTFTAHAVAFPLDDRWVLALVGSSGSGRTPDDAQAVAAAQAARLG